MALALVVRLAVVAVDSSYEPANDSLDYDRHARSIAAGEGYPRAGFLLEGGPSAIRPPAYPFLLGGVYALTGDSVGAARIAGAALGAAAVLLVYLIALRLWDGRVGLVAAGMAAVFPPLVLLSRELYSESLFIPLVLAAVLCVLIFRRSGLLRWVVLAGVVAGLAALTRSVGLLLLVPLVLGAWTGDRRSARAFVAPAVVLVCAALVISPWTLRNAVEFGRFVPVASGSGFTLAGVYNETSLDSEARGAWRTPQAVPEHAALFVTEGLDEATVDATLRREAASVAWDNPEYVLEAAGWGSLRLFEVVDGSVVDAQGRAADERGIGSQVRTVERIAVAIALALALLGVIALLRSRLGAEARGGSAHFRRAPLFFWLVPLLLLVSGALVGGLPRYRLPADPFLIILAGIGLVWAAVQLRAWWPLRGRAALAVVGGVAAFSLAGCGFGGDDEVQSESSSAAASAVSTAEADKYRAQASAICRRATRESRQLGAALGEAVLDDGVEFQEALTEEVFAPGMRTIERYAERLRQLGPAPNPSTETYVALFDPILELLRARLRAGRAGDIDNGRRLEERLDLLGDEQRAAARAADLPGCDRDFIEEFLSGFSS